MHVANQICIDLCKTLLSKYIFLWKLTYPSTHSINNLRFWWKHCARKVWPPLRLWREGGGLEAGYSRHQRLFREGGGRFSSSVSLKFDEKILLNYSDIFLYFSECFVNIYDVIYFIFFYEVLTKGRSEIWNC